MNLTGKPPRGLKAEKAKPDPEYLAAVRGLPCCICEKFFLVPATNTAAHHTICGRYSQRKTPDRDAIPLCWDHHQGALGIHTDKSSWVQEYGLDTDYIAATRARLET